jgi:apolipoprotein N-acyltransferase
VSITGKVNVWREETLYTRAGDWFAWLCVAVFVSLLAFQLFGREEKTHG